jgi:hypothetical protein
MTAFICTNPPSIPVRLYHHTKASNVVSLLNGDAKCVSFLLKNNLDKNDREELQMGIKLMKNVRTYLQANDKPSLLDQVTDFDNSYSLSFTENEVNKHMLSEYGDVRFEFDLRMFKIARPKKCEYYSDEDINELSRLYISEIKRREYITKESCDSLKIDKLMNVLLMENDLIEKISTIKRQNEWEQEGEWRIILFKQKEDSRLFFVEGKPRMRLDISLRYLTGITLFYNDDNKNEMRNVRSYLKRWKRWNKVFTFNVIMKKI